MALQLELSFESAESWRARTWCRGRFDGLFAYPSLPDNPYAVASADHLAYALGVVDAWRLVSAGRSNTGQSLMGEILSPSDGSNRALLS